MRKRSSDPTYEEYVERKKNKHNDTSPILPKDQWEIRVFGPDDTETSKPKDDNEDSVSTHQERVDALDDLAGHVPGMDKSMSIPDKLDAILDHLIDLTDVEGFVKSLPSKLQNFARSLHDKAKEQYDKDLEEKKPEEPKKEKKPEKPKKEKDMKNDTPDNTPSKGGSINRLARVYMIRKGYINVDVTRITEFLDSLADSLSYFLHSIGFKYVIHKHPVKLDDITEELVIRTAEYEIDLTASNHITVNRNKVSIQDGPYRPSVFISVTGAILSNDLNWDLEYEVYWSHGKNVGGKIIGKDLEFAGGRVEWPINSTVTGATNEFIKTLNYTLVKEMDSIGFLA